MGWVYVLILSATFFNACMDVFENTPNFNESIFKNWDKRFWCKDVSCNYARVILGYRLDAWHFSKSLMWLCIIGSIITAWCLPPYASCSEYVLNFIGLSAAPILVFPLFYHVIFRVK